MAKEHIVMFPFMAQGHIIPFLALAELISQRNPTYTITFLNTPLNIHNLQATLPTNSNIHLKSLPYRSSDFGLPPDRENTDSLPFPLLLRFIESGESLATHFTHFISDLTRLNDDNPPLLIIADVFFGWTVEIAKRFNTSHVSFSTCGAYGTAVYFSMWLHLPHAKTDLPEFTAPGFPETFKLQRNQLPVYLRDADGNDGWSKFFRRQISLSLTSDAMVCNTVEEVEVEGLRLLRKNTGLRVWCIGPLLPSLSSSSHGRSGRKCGMEVSCIMNWLDKQQLGSVVYICFGTMNTISAAQMMSLAIGLRSSGHPFVWVLRLPLGFEPNSEFRPEWLPEEFEAKMQGSGQGILIHGWAPQLEILAHECIGAFVSHCGWNSTLESLSRGVCVIGWPLAAEQFYNSKMLEEELEVGVELARGAVDDVRSEEVERLVRLVTEDDDKGKAMKKKAKKYKEMIREAMREEGEVRGSSIRSVDEFVEMAITFRSSNAISKD